MMIYRKPEFPGPLFGWKVFFIAFGLVLAAWLSLFVAVFTALKMAGA